MKHYGNELKDLVQLAMAADGVNIPDKFHEINWPRIPHLLGTSVKVEKGTKKGYLTAICYLAPAKLSLRYGGTNMCAYASPGCIAACLHMSGQLAMADNAKLWKTLLYTWRPDNFWSLMVLDIERHVRKAARLNLKPCVRINGTSDIVVPGWVMQQFPDVQFYDYSKDVSKALKWARGEFPENYHVTFSRSETNHDDAMRVLKAGGNVAIVFDTLPERWHGYPVVNGDETDLTFTYPKGSIVGLVPKGRNGRRDKSGFVVQTSIPVLTGSL